MRIIPLALLILIAAPALAQTVAPADPVSSNSIPFNTQRTQGDGVPVTTTTTTTMNAAPAAAGAGVGLGKIFDEADTNRDNVVTREEFLAKAERHFGLADTNKDNKITREEMQAQQNSVMQQMQQNLFGKGATWQGKLNEFIGGGATTTTTTTPAAPVVPVVTPPTAPTTPRTY